MENVGRKMRKGARERWTKILIYYSYLFGAREMFTSSNQFIFFLHYRVSTQCFAVFAPQTLIEALIKTLRKFKKIFFKDSLTNLVLIF